MNESVFVKLGLDLDNLETIHEWLINDYNVTLNVGLLYDFMTLIRNSRICWGLFRENGDGDVLCIGCAFAKVSIGVLIIEFFSIHPDYRKQGWGARFAHTIVSHFHRLNKIHTTQLDSLPNSVGFWEKVGFVPSRYQPSSTVKMLLKVLIEADAIIMQ